jgi:hypothetical protein
LGSLNAIYKKPGLSNLKKQIPRVMKPILKKQIPRVIEETDPEGYQAYIN